MSPLDKVVLRERRGHGELEGLDALGDPGVLEGELLELLGKGEGGRGVSSSDGGGGLVDGESEGSSSEDRHGDDGIVDEWCLRGGSVIGTSRTIIR